MNKVDLLAYLKEAGLVQGNKTQSILAILLDYPDGILRCCMREEILKRNLDIGQAAGHIRFLRDAGVNIPRVKRQRCEVHSVTETKDKVVEPYLTGNAYARATYSPKEFATIRKILGHRDAFTGIHSTTNPEVDHRLPVTRLKELEGSQEAKVDVKNPEEVKNQYQLLTRDNNLYKSRVCEKCVKTNNKPDRFLSIKIPVSIGGGKPYDKDTNNCFSCPLAYPETFLESLEHKSTIQVLEE
jgi:hypothetical protein